MNCLVPKSPAKVHGIVCDEREVSGANLQHQLMIFETAHPQVDDMICLVLPIMSDFDEGGMQALVD